MSWVPVTGLFLGLSFAALASTTQSVSPVPTVKQTTFAYDAGSVRVSSDNAFIGSEAVRLAGPSLGSIAKTVAAKTTVRMTQGIKDAQGIVRFGGYDPATKTVHLGGVGHFGGMKAAGGTPLPGRTPGLSMLETEKEVIWANDSLSLPKALTTDEAAGIQKALEAQFPTKAVRQVTELR